MPTETITDIGVTTISLAGKTNLVIKEFVSCGGFGDDSPATGGGFSGLGSPGGGGGARLVTVPIPNEDIEVFVTNGGTDLTITLGEKDNSSIFLGGAGLTLFPGEDGSTCTTPGDRAEGGRYDPGQDEFGWVTDPSSMYGPGAPAELESNLTTGYGGGSAGGAGGVAGNSNVGQIGGAAVDSDGAGGDGGDVAENGSPGQFPGGGGGGGGTGITTGGIGAGPKAVIDYDLIVPVITSNGGGPTASINVNDGETAVTTVVVDTPASVGLFNGDSSEFSVTQDDSTHWTITKDSPFDYATQSSFTFTIRATNEDNSETDEQVLTIHVRDPNGEPADDQILSNVLRLALTNPLSTISTKYSYLNRRTNP